MFDLGLYLINKWHQLLKDYGTCSLLFLVLICLLLKNSIQSFFGIRTSAFQHVSNPIKKHLSRILRRSPKKCSMLLVHWFPVTSSCLVGTPCQRQRTRIYSIRLRNVITTSMHTSSLLNSQTNWDSKYVCPLPERVLRAPLGSIPFDHWVVSKRDPLSPCSCVAETKNDERKCRSSCRRCPCCFWSTLLLFHYYTTPIGTNQSSRRFSRVLVGCKNKALSPHERPRS